MSRRTQVSSEACSWALGIASTLTLSFQKIADKCEDRVKSLVNLGWKRQA